MKTLLAVLLAISLVSPSFAADLPPSRAKQIRTDTSGFNNNLSSADDTTQKALDTLDNMVSGAPTDADYLVGTTNASLSAEIVVGTTPGGELGGTWASPTVDSTHSGSAHHASVTLDTNVDTLLSLSTQALGLDTQTANYVFAGPTAAPAAVPTFRALVDNDIPNNITITETDPNALLTAGTDNVKDTHIDWGTGAAQVSPSDFANEDIGDITITTGAWAVEDDSHAHTGTTLSSIDISADTNLTAGDGLTLTDDDLDVDYNSTNLKITTNQINTIQDIATTSSPTFVGLTLSGAISTPTNITASGTIQGEQLTSTDDADINDVLTVGSLVTDTGGITLLAGQDIRPSANSTTAINIAQADGTDFVVFDSTNKRMGLGADFSSIVPQQLLHMSWGTSIVVNLAKPAAATGTPGSAGLMADGTYYYVITSLDAAGGETIKGTESAAITVSAGGTGSVALSWTAIAGAVSYKIYRTTTSGTYTTPCYITQVYTNSHTDIALDASAGAPPAATTGYINRINANSNSWLGGSSSKLGIGVLSGAPASMLHLSDNTSGGGVTIEVASDNANSSQNIFRKARGTVQVKTVVQSADCLGQFNFRGYDGTAYIVAADIRGYVDGTPGTNDMPGRLGFYTTADGASSATERMRIDNGGKVYINDTTNAEQTIGLTINQGANDDTIFSIKSSDVGHSFTSLYEADTYGIMRKLSATLGGVWQIGLSDGDATGLQLQGNIGIADPTDTTAAVIIDGRKLSGTTTAALGNAETILNISNSGTAKVSILGNGDTSVTGDLTVTGGDIALGTTSIFSGGDTASLNNIDAVDATTETTFESAIDALANLTTVGTVTIGTWNAGAVTSSGLITGNANMAVKNGATTAGVLSLYEDSDAGSNLASFQVPALTANTVYTLPADDGDAGEQLQTDGAGGLTWEAAGGGAATLAQTLAAGADANDVSITSMAKLEGFDAQVYVDLGTNGKVILEADVEVEITSPAEITGLLTLTGGQIDFPAAQSASAGANTLDDYEEGTWDPTYTTTGGSFTYQFQFGSYVKIGKYVFCNFWIKTNASTVGTGDVQLGGLPFTIVNNDNVEGAGSIGEADSFAGDVPIALDIYQAQTYIEPVYRTAVNGDATTLQGADLDSGNAKNSIRGSFWYYAAN